jgi:hypothetical protein
MREFERAWETRIYFTRAPTLEEHNELVHDMLSVATGRGAGKRFMVVPHFVDLTGGHCLVRHCQTLLGTMHAGVRILFNSHYAWEACQALDLLTRPQSVSLQSTTIFITLALLQGISRAHIRDMYSERNGGSWKGLTDAMSSAEQMLRRMAQVPNRGLTTGPPPIEWLRPVTTEPIFFKVALERRARLAG